MAFPWALARLLPSAVRVRIRSRSTSASPPSTANINRPVLLVLSAHGSAKDLNGALASTIRLTMLNRSNVLRKPVDPRHRHHVAGAEFPEHLVKLAPVGPRPRHLVPVDVPAAASGLAKLLKLAVEGLPVGRDAGIPDRPFFKVSFVHILCKP